MYEPPTEYDDHWKTAKAFSILAALFGCVGIAVSCAAFRAPKAVRWAWIPFSLTCLLQGLTFVFKSSKGCSSTPDDYSSSMVKIRECELANSGRVGIAAVCMWFLCFIGTARWGRWFHHLFGKIKSCWSSVASCIAGCNRLRSPCSHCVSCIQQKCICYKNRRAVENQGSP